MARTFPPQIVYVPGVAGQALTNTVGSTVTIYRDSALTTIESNLQLADGTPVPSAVVTVDASSRTPRLKLTGDTVTLLYAKPSSSSLSTPIVADAEETLALVNPATVVRSTAPQFPNGLLNLGTSADLFGDSITYGVGASAPANDYAQLLAADKQWTGTVVNHGVSGDQVWDQAAGVFAKTVAATSQSTLMIGTNDQRHYSGGAAYRAVFGRSHQALLAWLAIPEAAKFRGQNPVVTKSGSWTGSGAYSGAVGVSSVTAGDTCTVTCYGRTVFLCSLFQESVTSTYKVTVDGRDFGTYSTGTGGAGTYNGATYGPNLIRISGLADGAHTVVLTVVTASSGNPAYFMWAAGTAGAESRYGPLVAVATIPRFTAAGYSASGGSDLIVRQYNDLIVSNVRQLQEDGLNVALADVSANINPATHLSSDGVHPNDTGHSIIRDTFLQATNALPYPSERWVPGGRQAQFVGVKVTRSAAYNVPSGSTTAIPWDAEAAAPDGYDTHGFHDNSTNPSRLTCPPGQAGFYRVSGCWGTTGPFADQVRVAGRLRKNGVDIKGGVAEASSSGAAGFVYPNPSTTVYLDEGDYIELATFQNSGGASALDTSLSALEMVKLGPPLNFL